MSFFKSDVVRAEMTEISELQEEVYQNVFKFPSMSKKEIRACRYSGKTFGKTKSSLYKDEFI